MVQECGDLCRITITRAGIIAVCYCGILDSSGGCLTDKDFKLAGRLTIKGPKLGQRWTFSVDTVSRFEYEGYGLESANSLRIISSTGSVLGLWKPFLHLLAEITILTRTDKHW